MDGRGSKLEVEGTGKRVESMARGEMGKGEERVELGIFIKKGMMRRRDGEMGNLKRHVGVVAGEVMGLGEMGAWGRSEEGEVGREQ